MNTESEARMRLNEANRMLDIAKEADEFARTYPEEFYHFVRYLALNRGMVLSTGDDAAYEGWKYRTYQDLVFDLGTPRKAPLFVPDELPAMPIKQCYANSYQLATEPGLDLTYVEGYAQTNLLVVDHAWLEDAQGRIIDPTWANLDLPIDFEVTYYGIRFDAGFLDGRAFETGELSVLHSDWRIDMAALRFGFEVDERGTVIGGRSR